MTSLPFGGPFYEKIIGVCCMGKDPKEVLRKGRISAEPWVVLFRERGRPFRSVWRVRSGITHTAHERAMDDLLR